MSAIFPLIPVKLLFIGLTVYIWTQLIKRGTALNQPRVSRLMLGAAILSIILSVISVGKIYPYGAVTDLLIFAVATSLFMTLPMRTFVGRILGFLLIALPLLGPLAYLLHYQVVGGAMNKDSFIAVFQTTSAEAGEYLASFTSVMSVIPLLLAAALLIWVVKHNNDTPRQTLPIRTTALYSLLAFVMIALAPLEKGLFTYPVDVYVSYQKEISTTKERMAQFSERKINKDFHISKEGEGEVYVVVVGESLNKHHMGVYGYELDTTPNLQRLKDEGNLFIADNSFSNYPGTMAALSHALTAANQKNNKHYTQSLGIVELMNEAGFVTHWLGNQPLSNSYDMILGLIAKEAQDVQLTFDIEFHSMSHKDHQPDGVLLPLYKDVLAQRDAGKNQVIFVHLMGNHTDYCERYPEDYKRYEVATLDAIYSHIFKGGLGHSRECYDNSILYNDHVVSTLIDDLQSTLGEEGIGGLIYFADHSEDIERGVGHSSANFSFDMVESPTLIWLSKAYQQHNADKTAALRHNLGQYYPNDFIFDTVVGMSGTRLDSDAYCSSCDLFSFDYELPLENARTMHGKLAYKPLKDLQPAATVTSQ
ncbi:phosphoethanolamine transferase [Thalassolituus hydrocarboniclasticus]|uniref:Sulfatase-like hydrolase/transferase n=1 Tax=Thalassolituus hydrocarboniclasticus TaxID=2742796 RepID=A0ABY6A9J3_9GAMM|nr:phosphoethanolamine transferase [Thalassolituus hydrocarboniclasticus]UXD87661.1 sulfatase-like hydrolase/transferase [Thalassolituus hydrocarboniclasticus]